MISYITQLVTTFCKQLTIFNAREKQHLVSYFFYCTYSLKNYLKQNLHFKSPLSSSSECKSFWIFPSHSISQCTSPFLLAAAYAPGITLRSIHEDHSPRTPHNQIRLHDDEHKRRIKEANYLCVNQTLWRAFACSVKIRFPGWILK